MVLSLENPHIIYHVLCTFQHDVDDFSTETKQTLIHLAKCSKTLRAWTKEKYDWENQMRLQMAKEEKLTKFTVWSMDIPLEFASTCHVFKGTELFKSIPVPQRESVPAFNSMTHSENPFKNGANYLDIQDDGSYKISTFTTWFQPDKKTLTLLESCDDKTKEIITMVPESNVGICRTHKVMCFLKQFQIIIMVAYAYDQSTQVYFVRRNSATGRIKHCKISDPTGMLGFSLNFVVNGPYLYLCSSVGRDVHVNQLDVTTMSVIKLPVFTLCPSFGDIGHPRVPLMTCISKLQGKSRFRTLIGPLKRINETTGTYCAATFDTASCILHRESEVTLSTLKSHIRIITNLTENTGIGFNAGTDPQAIEIPIPNKCVSCSEPKTL